MYGNQSTLHASSLYTNKKVYDHILILRLENLIIVHTSFLFHSPSSQAVLNGQVLSVTLCFKKLTIHEHDKKKTTQIVPKSIC